MTVPAAAAGARAARTLPERVTLNPSALARDGQIRYQVQDGDRVRVLGVTATGTVRALTAVAGLGPLSTSALTRELAGRLDGAAAAQRAVRSGFDCGLLVAAGDDAQPGGSPRPEPSAAAERHASTAPPRGYEQAFADLAQVARFNVLFDRALDARTLLTVAFTDRFGVAGRANLVDAAADLLATAGRRARRLNGATSEDFGPADGSLTQLLRLRAAAWQALAGWASGGLPVRLDPGRLAALAGQLPERFTATQTTYRSLAEPRDGSLTVLAFESVAVESRRHGPRTAEQWCQVDLVHRPDTDTLALVDADGAEFIVPGAAGRVAGGRPAPLVAAAWLSGAGLLVDPFAAVVARPDGPDGPDGPEGSAADGGAPLITAGRVILDSRARQREGRPIWLIDCGGGAT
jgi:hypothetical protein